MLVMMIVIVVVAALSGALFGMKAFGVQLVLSSGWAKCRQATLRAPLKLLMVIA